MPIFLYNTLTRRKEKFIPLRRARVGLYSCGPTVYNYAHIGNLRTYVFADTLKRVLNFVGYAVQHIMNITDVGHLTSDADTGDDKLEKGAAREQKTVWEIAAFYTRAFKSDIKLLNILPPDRYTKATDHIKEQIKLVQKLESGGCTYENKQAVYFDTSRVSDYGKLAGGARLLKIGAGGRSGASVEIDPYKKNPADFVLWFKRAGKFKNHIMHWPSPWGEGFPGWHIECSAMSMKYLGETIDIHTGGIDHIAIHHTNEIAQSESATGKPFVRYFIHGNFLTIGESAKMAKSGENFITLGTVRDRGFRPRALRYIFLTAHYRKELAFTWESLKAAESALGSLETIMQTRFLKTAQAKTSTSKKEEGKILAGFQAALADDLNTPRALSALWKAAKSDLPLDRKQRLIKKFDAALGLGLSSIKLTSIPPRIRKMAEERELYRNRKQFIQSDRLRNKLKRLGYDVEDKATGTCLKPLSLKSRPRTKTPN